MSTLGYKVFWLCVLLFLELGSAIATASPNYIREERLAFPLDGRKVSTTLPLDPSRQYEIKVSSSHSLRPLLGSNYPVRVYVYVNDTSIPAVWERDGRHDDLRAFFVYPATTEFYVPKLYAFVWGNERPLVVSAAQDFSKAIPEAQLTVTDIVDRRIKYVFIAAVIVLILLLIVAGIIGIEWKFGARGRAQKQLAREEAERQAEAGRIQRAEEVAREQERQKIQGYQEALTVLILEYDSRPHLEDEAWIVQYATKHRRGLLAQRQKIINEHKTFHTTDPDYITYLQARAPHIYRRAIWWMQALAKAEEIEPGHVKRPLTEEEWEEQITRYRARQLARLRVAAEDRIAIEKQNLDLFNQFCSELDQYDLDLDERTQREQEFKDALFGADSGGEAGNGFKQL